MTDEAKEARRAYQRAWNKAHPDKVKQYNESYWNRKAAKAAAEAEQGQEAENREAQA